MPNPRRTNFLLYDLSVIMTDMYGKVLELWKKLALSKNAQIKVLRMVNDQFLIGVTGVIFDEEHNVLIVKHTYRRVPWSLPGGYLKAGEHPKKGLEREVYEETNFRVKVEKIIKTQHDEHQAKLDMCYIGTYKKGKFKKSEEVTEYGFFPRDKLPKLIDDQYEQIDLAYQRYSKTHTKPLMKRFKHFISSSKTMLMGWKSKS